MNRDSSNTALLFTSLDQTRSTSTGGNLRFLGDTGLPSTNRSMTPSGPETNFKTKT